MYAKRKSLRGSKRSAKSSTSRSSHYRRKRYTRKPRLSGPRPIPKFLAAQVNPFDPQVRGVRVPDENTAPSSSFHTYDQCSIGALASTANGTESNRLSMILFTPAVYQYGVVPTNNVDTNTASQVTWSTTSWTTGGLIPDKFTQVSAAYSVCRPVAHGIRICCPLKPTEAQGFLHIALMTVSMRAQIGPGDNNGAAVAVPNTISRMRELPHYRRVTLASLTQEPLVVTNRFLDQTAFRYSDVGTNDLATQTTPGGNHVPLSWMCILVAVESHNQTAGTSLAVVENITHYEGQSRPDALNQDDSPEPTEPDHFDGTAATISAFPACWTNSEFSNAVQTASNGFFNWLVKHGRRGIAMGVASAVSWTTQRALTGRGLPGVNTGRSM